MSEIHVLDYNSPRLSDRAIQDIVTAIATRNPTQFTNTNKGIIAKFDADEDCNFIFAPGSIRKFQANQLYASLSPHTQNDRNIYITDPPNAIYARPVHEIRNELQINHRTDIIGLSKFISKRTQRNYIIITPINKEETKKIATLGKVYIFNHELPAQAKRNVPVRNTQSTVRQGAPRPDVLHDPIQYSGPDQSSSSPQLSGQPGSVLPAQSYGRGAQYNLNYQAPHRQQQFWSSHPPPSGPVQHVQQVQTATNGLAQQPSHHLNVHNGPPSYQVPTDPVQRVQQIQTAPTGPAQQPAQQLNIPNSSPSHQVPHQGYGPIPNGPTGAQNAAAAQPNQYGSTLGSQTAPPQGPYCQNEQNLIVYSYNIINLCNSLSTGVETPEKFVSNFNLILSENGLIPINVPQSVIESSYQMYLSKQSNGPSPSISTSTAHSATPIASRPATPIVSQSTTSIVDQSAVPIISQSEASIVSQSAALIVSQPTAPTVSLPPTSIVSQSVAPIVSQSPTPIVSQSTTHIVPQSTTPTVSHSSSSISPSTPFHTATPTTINTATSTSPSLPAYQVSTSTTSPLPVTTPSIESTPIQRRPIQQYTTPLTNVVFNPVTSSENTPSSTILNISSSLSNLFSNIRQSTPINLLSTKRNNLFRTNMGWSRNKPLFDI